MAQGIFLGTSVINGVPTLFQYTMETGNPVVLVEKFTPSKEELLNPQPVDFSLFASGGNEEFVFSQPLAESFAAKGVKCRVVPDEE
jgi:hypothetical protein